MIAQIRTQSIEEIKLLCAAVGECELLQSDRYSWGALTHYISAPVSSLEIEKKINALKTGTLISDGVKLIGYVRKLPNSK